MRTAGAVLVLVMALAVSACDDDKPPAAKELAEVLWNRQPGPRAIGEHEYAYDTELKGQNARVFVRVRHADERQRVLEVRCFDADGDCSVNDLAPRRRQVTTGASSDKGAKFYRLDGGPLDGCVQRVEPGSSVQVATPSYATAQWKIAAEQPLR